MTFGIPGHSRSARLRLTIAIGSPARLVVRRKLATLPRYEAEHTEEFWSDLHSFGRHRQSARRRTDGGPSSAHRRRRIGVRGSLDLGEALKGLPDVLTRHTRVALADVRIGRIDAHQQQPARVESQVGSLAWRSRCDRPAPR
jgi:hypothetical protein